MLHDKNKEYETQIMLHDKNTNGQASINPNQEKNKKHKQCFTIKIKNKKHKECFTIIRMGRYQSIPTKREENETQTMLHDKITNGQVSINPNQERRIRNTIPASTIRNNELPCENIAKKTATKKYRLLHIY